MRGKVYETATDGGCRGNPGIGSWAFVVQLGTDIKGKSGFSKHTTNNEMELLALLELMRWATKLPAGSKVNVYMDSAYVLNGYTKWMHGWKNRMWRTASNQPVKNKGLWHDVYHLSKDPTLPEINLVKVKGHSGHPLNDAADERCNVAMDEYELSLI